MMLLEHKVSASLIPRPSNSARDRRAALRYGFESRGKAPPLSGMSAMAETGPKLMAAFDPKRTLPGLLMVKQLSE